MGGGEAAASALERRYRVVLRAYPASYRADRGDEILGTLLEGAPAGQTAPSWSWRDIYTLLLAGLRARTLQNHRLSTPANVRLAAMLSLAILLGTLAAERVGLGLRAALGESGVPLARYLGSAANLTAVGSASLIAVALNRGASCSRGDRVDAARRERQDGSTSC